MIGLHTVQEVRAAEEPLLAALPEGTLMQRAATGLATVCLRLLGSAYGRRVVLLVGTGNNGGDALFAGARLARRGAQVSAVSLLGRPHQAALAAFRAAGGRLIDPGEDGSDLSAGIGGARPGPFDLALDGIVGIGGRPGLPDQVTAVLQDLSAAAVPVIAVDLPSGVDADTGAVPGPAVSATVTVSFGAAKPSELIEPARSHCGRIIAVDLGFVPDAEVTTLDLLEEDDLARGWPYPDVRSSKYSRGVVGIDAGSADYPGAGILAAHGAVFAGAGMVRFHGSEEARRVLTGALPNIVYADGRVQARLYGSGWGERSDGTEAISRGLADGLPAVVDADGLRYLPAGGLTPDWLITPHAGELARLLDCPRSDVEADPVAAARHGADSTGATVLLKGATQVVAQPGHRSVLIAVPGPSWTAQAGSGDVLAGICATLLAAGLPAPRAAALGASLQAVTAAALPGPVPPHELARHAAVVLGRLQARAREIADGPGGRSRS